MYTREDIFEAPEALTTRGRLGGGGGGGSGGILPQKIFKFRVSEMPCPAFSAGHFQ